MQYRFLLGGLFAILVSSFAVPAHAQDLGDDTSDSEETSSESSSFGDDSSETTTSTSTTSSSSSSTEASTNGLKEGRSALAFEVPGGGNPYADGLLGYWYMITSNINLGINFGMGIDSTTTVANLDTNAEETTTRTGFDLALVPALRYYLSTDGKVTPYVLGQLAFRKFFDGDNDTSADPTSDNFNSALQPELSLTGGFGVEWFPVEHFSIGGHIGLGIDILRQDSGGGGQGSTLTRNGLRIGTITSALQANIYFF